MLTKIMTIYISHFCWLNGMNSPMFCGKPMFSLPSIVPEVISEMPRRSMRRNHPPGHSKRRPREKSLRCPSRSLNWLVRFIPSNMGILATKIRVASAYGWIIARGVTGPFYLEVSWNRGIPKSSILVGFFLVNQPAIGNPPFWETTISLFANCSPSDLGCWEPEI